MPKENANKKIMMEMLTHITTSIEDLKADINKRFDETNQRIDKIEQRLEKVNQNTNFLAEEIGKLKSLINGQVVLTETQRIMQKSEGMVQLQDECLNSVQMSSNSLKHLEELWNNVLTQIEQQISKPSFETWIKSTNLVAYKENGATAIVSAPNSFARDWLENHYGHLITTILTMLTGEDLVLQFIVQKNQDMDDFDLIVPIK